MTDLDRLAVIILAGFVLGSTFLVAVEHFRAWRKDPAGKLIPGHVAAIAFSYDLLLIALMTRPLDWRAAFYIPALALGGIAMFFMLRYQRERMSKVRKGG